MRTEDMMPIRDRRFGEERALYEGRDLYLTDCAFDGAEDGESALKEARNIRAERVYCNLRYPFWHGKELMIDACEMTEQCRAPLWYSEDVAISNTKIRGVKALRECTRVSLRKNDIRSAEFGWSLREVRLIDCTLSGEYCFLHAADIDMRRCRFEGKYAFQYVTGALIENCVLNTKDAFWHAKNVTVQNCTVSGEYLAWYSENVTFINCTISGTQPFCYCKNLTLIDCSLTDADLAFEKSEVHATLTSPVVSIKNPYAGSIAVPAVGELILTDAAAQCKITVG